MRLVPSGSSLTKREHASGRQARSWVSLSTSAVTGWTGWIWERILPWNGGTDLLHPPSLALLHEPHNGDLSVRDGHRASMILDHSCHSSPIRSVTSACIEPRSDILCGKSPDVVSTAIAPKVTIGWRRLGPTDRTRCFKFICLVAICDELAIPCYCNSALYFWWITIILNWAAEMLNRNGHLDR